MKLTEVASRSDDVLTEVERAIVGKRSALRLILMSLLAGGHVLIEDYPGLAKTLAARSFARVLGLSFKPPVLLPVSSDSASSESSLPRTCFRAT